MSEERTNDEQADEGTSRGAALVGKVEEKLGWLTGDRQEEAKGRLRQADAADVDPVDDAVPADEDVAAAEAVDEAELQVRDEHGDLAPGVGPDS